MRDSVTLSKPAALHVGGAVIAPLSRLDEHASLPPLAQSAAVERAWTVDATSAGGAAGLPGLEDRCK